MLFSGEEGLKPTEASSGGELRGRSSAASCSRSPTVLVLDEPTNHLDLESINALNIAPQFEGTAVSVTHDQTLLEEVGTRACTSRRRAADFKGTYEEFEGSVAGEMT